MEKHAGAVIIGAAIIVATSIYIFFSPYQSCVRANAFTGYAMAARHCIGK
ncbi:hypothetical protein [Sinorhizobium meliloti]|nr:hypothetical protein [Sinorhizobium meliloti]